MARTKQGKKERVAASGSKSDAAWAWPSKDAQVATLGETSTESKTKSAAAEKQKEAEQVGDLASGAFADVEDEIASEEEEDADEEGDSDSDDEGVDEEGMARLMKALGDDGLDDFDRAQLGVLAGEDDEDEDEEGDSEGGEEDFEIEAVEEDSGSLSDEESEGEEEEQEDAEAQEGVDDEEEDEEEQEEVALEDVDGVLDDDVVPKQKLEIDNEVALKRIRETFQLNPALPWTETLVLSYPQTIDVDVNDDLNRELAFYKQALHSANAARSLAHKHNFPFTRPSDYFAEMVKTDAHMERIRQRLLDESATIKKSEDKRKEREGKKFGKQVQLEKIKEREREKKGMEERLKGLKRKRKDILDGAETKGGDDDFDIAVEDAILDRPNKRSKGGPADTGRGGGGSRGLNRKARDSKYGFGGGNKRSKQNTRDSTDDFGSRRGEHGKGGRGGFEGGRRGGKSGKSTGSSRPGKSRRMAARTRR